MTFKDHFSGHARSYSEHRPRYGVPVLAWLASLAPQQATVWDAGTGNGQLAGLLGSHFARVIATDASAEQVGNATPHPRVIYRNEPAEASSLEPGSVGLVTVAQAAHWFDLPRFYAEVRRVAAPGAPIVLLGYELMTISAAIDPIVAWFYKPVVGEYWPPERAHLETGYRDLAFPFPPIRVPPLALTHDWTLDQLMGYVGTWSAVTRYTQARGVDPLPMLRARLDLEWPDSEAPRTIHWPLVVKAGTVSPPGS